MPVDQRRINGPEVSVPYQIYVDSTSSKTENPENCLKKRKDGRKFQDVRKICKVMFYKIIIYFN